MVMALLSDVRRQNIVTCGTYLAYIRMRRSLLFKDQFEAFVNQL